MIKLNEQTDMRTFWQAYPLLSRILIWILLPLVVSLGGIYAYIIHHLSAPEKAFELFTLGSTAQVELHNRHSVAIRAQDSKDAFYALGYAHAKSRFWEMDSARKIAKGRTSEYFGQKMTKFDLFMRNLEFVSSSELAWREMSKRNREAVQAYTAGINKAINEFKLLPLQLELLGEDAEPWQPVDSLLLMRLYSWEMSNGLNKDLAQVLLSQVMGAKTAIKLLEKLDLTHLPLFELALLSAESKHEEWLLNPNLFSDYRGGDAYILNKEDQQGTETIHFQNVSSSHFYVPQFYVAAIASPQFNVAGLTIPGIPTFFSGNNGQITWSMTPYNVENQGIVLESLNPLDFNQYQSFGQTKQLQAIEEKIGVKRDFLAKFDVNLLRKKTDQGPLIVEQPSIIEGAAYSLRWLGSTDKNQSLEALMGLPYARNWEEFEQSLQLYVAPTAEFLFSGDKGKLKKTYRGFYYDKQSALTLPENKGQQSAFAQVHSLAELNRETDSNHSAVIFGSDRYQTNAPVINQDNDKRLKQISAQKLNQSDELHSAKLQTEAHFSHFLGVLNKSNSALSKRLLEKKLTLHEKSIVNYIWQQELNGLLVNHFFAGLSQYHAGNILKTYLKNYANSGLTDYVFNDDSDICLAKHEANTEDVCVQLQKQALNNIEPVLVEALSTGLAHRRSDLNEAPASTFVSIMSDFSPLTNLLLDAIELSTCLDKKVEPNAIGDQNYKLRLISHLSTRTSTPSSVQFAVKDRGCQGSSSTFTLDSL